jgi:hypothetical protein
LIGRQPEPNLADPSVIGASYEFPLSTDASIAASGSVYLAHAAFDEAVKQYPDQRLTSRNGILVMREHPDPRSKPR